MYLVHYTELYCGLSRKIVFFFSFFFVHSILLGPKRCVLNLLKVKINIDFYFYFNLDLKIPLASPEFMQFDLSLFFY